MMASRFGTGSPKKGNGALNIGGWEIDLNWKTILIFTISVLVITLISVFFFVLSGMWRQVQPDPRPSGSISQPAIIKADVTPIDKRVNVLIMGVDERPDDKGRSDVLIVASIPSEKDNDDNITLISIPRDTMVWLPETGGIDKINHLYTWYDAEFTTNAVSRLLDIEIEGYVFVNLEGLVGLVDELGGVTVDVGDERLYYYDPYQDLYIDIPAGEQRLDGEQAMHFVRYREYATADIGRIEAQQRFLQACVDEFMAKKYDLLALTGLIRQGLSMVTTDISFNRIVSIADAAVKNASKPMDTITLVGDGLYWEGLSYYILRYEETLELIAEHLLPEEKRERYVREHMNESWVRDYEWRRAQAYDQSLLIWERGYLEDPEPTWTAQGSLEDDITAPGTVDEQGYAETGDGDTQMTGGADAGYRPSGNADEVYGDATDPRDTNVPTASDPADPTSGAESPDEASGNDEEPETGEGGAIRQPGWSTQSPGDQTPNQPGDGGDPVGGEDDSNTSPGDDEAGTEFSEEIVVIGDEGDGEGGS